MNHIKTVLALGLLIWLQIIIAGLILNNTLAGFAIGSAIYILILAFDTIINKDKS